MAKDKAIVPDIDAEIVHEGTRISLPALPKEMSKESAISILKRALKDELTEIDVNEVVDCFPFDGAIAMTHCMREMFGWAQPVPTPSFFGPIPPDVISVEVGPGRYEQVLWGRFSMPGVEGTLTTTWATVRDRMVFKIGGTVQKGSLGVVKRLADSIREYVAKNSVYRSKAIQLQVDHEGKLQLDLSHPPTFLDVSGIREEDVIFSDYVQTALRTSLLTPIKHTAACKAAGIPVKRGVLLSGPYGVGKTLMAHVTAKTCEDNGWTFIMIGRASALHEVIPLAEQYAPAVVFAEDVDRVISGQDRTVSVDDLLNTIDGVQSKNRDIMVVLTTNHVENINQAMLRPGRLDAIIDVRPPDADAVIRLIRHYSHGTLPVDADLNEAGAALEGQIPAIIREAVERAKLYALTRSGGETVDLTPEDVVVSAKAMHDHLELLNRKVETETDADKLVKALQTNLRPAFEGDSNGHKGLVFLAKRVDQICEHLDIDD